MKHVTVTAAAGATVEGRMQLSEAQARPRAHALKALDAKRGLYQTTGPVQFKRGEAFGFDGEIGKALADVLQVVPAAAAKAASLV